MYTQHDKKEDLEADASLLMKCRRREEIDFLLLLLLLLKAIFGVALAADSGINDNDNFIAQRNKRARNKPKQVTVRKPKTKHNCYTSIEKINERLRLSKTSINQSILLSQ